MRIVGLGIAGAVATTGIAATLLAESTTAAAAPSVQDTVAQLQANGNKVVVNKIGNGSSDQCSVVSVRSVQSQAQRPVPQVRGPNMVAFTTGHVTIKC